MQALPANPTKAGAVEWIGETDIEAAIREFKAALPGWWYSLGECEVSCDASCAPTAQSEDLALALVDKRFDDGFHCDLYQPSTMAESLRDVMSQALAAKLESHQPTPGVYGPGQGEG